MAVGGNEEGGTFVLQIKQTFFSLIIYSSIEHVNKYKLFKIVSDPFLAGAFAFTVPSTYNIGIWMLN